MDYRSANLQTTDLPIDFKCFGEICLVGNFGFFAMTLQCPN